MAQNSRIAASTPNRMTASTTSIGSNNSTERISGFQGPAGDNISNSGEISAVSRVRPESAETNMNENIIGYRRFWFPSITKWFSELNKVHAVTVLILCYCNLINYMDRSTIPGMIKFIKDDKHFNVTKDSTLGLLQTVFVIFYMVTAPLFGYLGDRYSRKWILLFGISVWSLSTLLGSFATNFWVFMFFRGLVGIGEASYSTIAPAMISDLFKSDSRSRVLALFYFAIPVGTGLGYMVGSEVAANVNDWRWGLRVTPFMGLVAILAITFLLVDPPRGASDGSMLSADRIPTEDIKGLARNKSFVLSTVAFTCVCFCVGALMWWGPLFAYYGAKAACGNKAGCERITEEDISFKFGIVMTLAGLIGVPAGSYIAQMLRHKIPNADPIVCGSSLLMSVPVLYGGFISARYDISWCYGLTFLAGLLLNCNWAIVSDITLYIVIPTRRSLASATQILVSHALGDAISPYLIGVISDYVKTIISHNLPPDEDLNNTNGTRLSTFMDCVSTTTSPGEKHEPQWFECEFRSLQYALFTSCFFQTIGGFIFLVMSWYVLGDKQTADRAVQEANQPVSATDLDEGSANALEDDGHFNVGDEREPIVRNSFADEQPTFVSSERTEPHLI